MDSFETESGTLKLMKSQDYLVPLLALLRRGWSAGGIAVQQHAQEIPPINQQSHVRRMSLQSSNSRRINWSGLFVSLEQC